MNWWIWVLLGLGLFGMEIMTPGGFFMIFFGAGALGVGTLVAFGLENMATQWLFFSIVSVASLLIFRNPLLRWVASRQKPMGEVDSLTNEVATALEDLPAGGMGKAELRGTTWNAKNDFSATLQRGQRCQVIKVEGLTLWLKPE